MRFSAKLLCAASLLGLSSVGQAQTIQDGKKFLEIEQYSNAGRVFRTLVAQNPTAEHLYLLGDYYLKAEKTDSALIYFEQGLTKDPKFALNHVGKGTVMIARKDKAGAQPHFDKARELSKGKSAEVLYRIGEAYTIYETNDPAIAVQSLASAATIDKKNPEIQMMMGDAYLLKNDGTNAANCYDRAVFLNPNLAKPYIRIGKVYIRARNYNEALKKYKEGLDKDTTYWPGYRQMGELYFLAGQYDKALYNYRKYISKSDDNPDTQYKYANFLLTNKNYPEALEVLKKLSGRVDNPLLFRGFGYAYYETAKYPESIQNMETFFAKVSPDLIRPSDYEYYGKAMISSGKDSTKGFENLRKAVAMDTAAVSSTRAELARILFSAKKYKEAAVEYDAIAVKNPKQNPTDYFNLGKAHYFAKDYVKADTAFGSVIQLAPTFASGYLWRGRSSAKLDPESTKGTALPFYEKYIGEAEKDKDKFKKDLVEAYSYFGYFQYLKKDFAKSDEFWNKVLAIDAANKRAADGVLLNKEAQKGAAKPKGK